MQDQDLQMLVLEAAHSFIIHSPWVPVQKQLKWADTMYSAAKALESYRDGKTADATESRQAFTEDLKSMVYTPIDNIADAYKTWMMQRSAQRSAEAIENLGRALDKARDLCASDPVQAKRNLIGALNRVFDHLNEIEGDDKHTKIPFREELIN